MLQQRSPSSLSCTATGQEADFPSVQYLRKRYEKLHKRKVSRSPVSNIEMDRSEMASPSPAGALDPSFLAIRALNGHAVSEGKPVVVHAIVECPEAENTGTLQSSPIRRVDKYECLASSEHRTRAFSTRVDRLMQVINQGWKIRFEESEHDDNVDVIACDTAISGGASQQESGTAQVVSNPENLVHSTNLEEDSLASSSLDTDDDEGQSSRSNTIRQSAFPQPLNWSPAAATAEKKNTDESRKKIAWEPIISESQRLSLQQRILNKIAEKERADSEAPATPKRQEETPSRISGQSKRGLHRRNTPQVPRTAGKSGSAETLGTPSRESGSDQLSPLRDIIRRKASRTSHQARLGHDKAFHPLKGTSARSPSTSTSYGESTEVLSREGESAEEYLAQKINKNQRVMSWVRRVKSALRLDRQSPGKTPGKTFSIYQDPSPENSESKIPRRTSPREEVMADNTNLRQPGYLKKNSFAQEREAARQVIPPSTPRKQRKPLTEISVNPKTPVRHPSRLHEKSIVGTSGAASLTKRKPVPARSDENNAFKGAASPIKRKPVPLLSDENDAPEELSTPVARSLARLEGRLPPPESSPFPIRRYRDDTSTYGSDVEVELERLKLNGPRPRRPVREGAWISPLRRAVERGFDCGLEAPEEN
ncbi:MAG: hypothetical protein Q9220_006965 [cf. Caloplaca sp. 1 TL-2023]